MTTALDSPLSIEHMPRTSGIYAIEHTCGDCYVGSSLNLYNRAYQHGNAMRNQTSQGSSRMIHKCGVEKGFGGFTIRVLEEVAENELNVRELEWIKKLSPALNSPRAARRGRGTDELTSITFDVSEDVSWVIEQLAEEEYRTVSSMVRILVDRGIAVFEAEQKARAK